eukprot:scpid100563/ scgid16904/ 
MSSAGEDGHRYFSRTLYPRGWTTVDTPKPGEAAEPFEILSPYVHTRKEESAVSYTPDWNYKGKFTEKKVTVEYWIQTGNVLVADRTIARFAASKASVGEKYEFSGEVDSNWSPAQAQEQSAVITVSTIRELVPSMDALIILEKIARTDPKTKEEGAAPGGKRKHVVATELAGPGKAEPKRKSGQDTPRRESKAEHTTTD